ncbi:desulfoferrodoxin family protein [Ferrigenium sp. UT5]|uniref:desulfoferrodoxin family protein n=1 Tax=Ferrigenium sp. UT5 TaxID=3242105 RepID=UPI0038B31E69
MNRRTFLTGAAAAAVVASIGKAGAAEHATDGLPAQNLFYTKENPGRWEKKAGTHVPHIEIVDGNVKLSTPHPMSEEHFIVRHTLLLADGTVVGAKTFTPKDSPISEYALPDGYKGKVFGTSFCNQHDFWLVEAKV